jgi:integrase
MPDRPQLGDVRAGSTPAAPDPRGVVRGEAKPSASGATSAVNPEALSRPLLTVAQAAIHLNVSQSWIRRHLVELPAVRCGRLLRIDSDGLKYKIENGKSLKSEKVNMTPRRYQRGSVIWKRKAGKEEVAYGVYRVDVQTATGIKRQQKKVRLGTRKELPTDSQARKKLNDIISEAESGPPTPEKMTYQDLAKSWQDSEGPTQTKPTADRYAMVLRAWLLPYWKDRNISSITRLDVQLFLNSKAPTYSRSSIRAMRLVLQMTLSFAALNKWIAAYPCVKIKTPRTTNQSRGIKRAEMSEQQKLAIAARLDEPYSTLVLLVTRIPLRIEEAIGIKLSDFEGHVLNVKRVVYEGAIYDLEPTERRRIPVMDGVLLDRLRNLGKGREWVFESSAGTPVNPNNARRRYLKPAAQELGINVCGWHDFRHSLTTELRRNGTHPKVISDLLGHKKVNLAMDVYDRSDLKDFEQALGSVGNQLLPTCDPTLRMQ